MVLHSTAKKLASCQSKTKKEGPPAGRGAKVGEGRKAFARAAPEGAGKKEASQEGLRDREI